MQGGVPYPLAAGGCTFHHGGTLHRTGGNVTALPRRAYIVNYRPKVSTGSVHMSTWTPGWT